MVRKLRVYRNYFKRGLDLVVAIIAIPFWLIVLLVVGLAIKLDDGGPVFYNAPRLGKNGVVFKMFKFRSMKVNAVDLRNEDGSTLSDKNDPRLTKIGRFLRTTSIDETPQLLNIILGDMSIVGPRPDLPEHLALYAGNEHRKLEIRPGVTGYNQANFRNSAIWKDRIQNDIYYIDRLSFRMDFKIIIQTFITVFKMRNVYTNQSSESTGQKL